MSFSSVSREMLGGSTGTVTKLVGATVVGAVAKKLWPFTEVRNNQVGFRRRFGKVHRAPNVPANPTTPQAIYGQLRHNHDGKPVPKMLRPGIHFVMPFSHSVEMVSIQPKTTDLGSLVMDRGWARTVEHIEDEEHVIRKDSAVKKQSEIHAEVEWRVSPLGFNAYRAVDEVDDRDAAVKRICRGALGKAARNVDDIQGADPELLTNVVNFYAYERLLKIGVELMHVTGISDNRSFAELVQPRDGQTSSLPPGILGAVGETGLHAVIEETA